MRTTVIPAQITTVEDKIVGSLNITQLMLLMVPVFWTTIVYTLLTPAMHIVWYKIPMVLVVLIVSLGLAIRINGVVVFNWLFVILSYKLRPKLYVFNKNDIYLKELDLPIEPKPALKTAKSTQPSTVAGARKINVKDFLLLQRFMKRRKMKLRYRSNAKGGLHVAFEHV
jgi:hypothetical protein